MKDCFITKNSQYKRVYNKKNISSNYHYTLFTAKNNLNISRIGITVTKKTGKAVMRNLLKRRTKDIFRQYYANIKPGYDYVFVLKKGACECSFQRLKKSFISVLKKQDKVIL